MPELPEVEAARRRIHALAVGRRVVDVVAHHDPIVFDEAPPAVVQSVLRRAIVVDTGRRGKYHWLTLNCGRHLLVHFGMTGSWTVVHAHQPGSEGVDLRFAKLECVLDSGVRLVLRDPRRLGRVRVREDVEGEPPVSTLGFDPLISMPRPDAFAALVRKRRTPVKALLLDQRFAAGVGNWIADEVLYQARIAPHRVAADLCDEEIKRLRDRLGSVIRKAVQVDAESDRFPRTWLFHHRWGRQTDARTTRGERIEHATIGGRTTAWVPGVQQ